ncbi:hypothetical protein ACFOPX_06695 [Helicobacter baculiformis]|uniref:Uncharacterized protein n=1 Tax=Helicobacter baculiformis TaxID=427351 RepID=A0ABV7ZHZ9_9HELI|nr:hypothetical protein [Helicobacter baculiformis]
MKDTHWQSVAFDIPVCGLYDATFFNQIHTHAQELRAKKAPLLFGSFLKMLPKPRLDNFPSTNPKSPDLYFVLDFKSSDLDYTNLYQHTKEILEKFPTILKRYTTCMSLP